MPELYCTQNGRKYVWLGAETMREKLYERLHVGRGEKQVRCRQQKKNSHAPKWNSTRTPRTFDCTVGAPISKNRDAPSSHPCYFR